MSSGTLPDALVIEPTPPAQGLSKLEVVPRRQVSNTLLVERVQARSIAVVRSMSVSNLGAALIEPEEARSGTIEVVAAPAASPPARALSIPLRPRTLQTLAPVRLERGSPEVRVEGLPVPAHPAVHKLAHPRPAADLFDDDAQTMTGGGFGLQHDPLSDAALDVSPRRVAHVLESLAGMSFGAEAAEHLSLAERLREYAELLDEARVVGGTLRRARRISRRVLAGIGARLLARRLFRAIKRRERTLVPCVVQGRCLLMEFSRVWRDDRPEKPHRYTVRIYGELGREKSWGRAKRGPVVPAYFEVTRVGLGRGPRKLNARELRALLFPKPPEPGPRRKVALHNAYVWAKRKGFSQGLVPPLAANPKDRPGDCTQDSLVAFLQMNLSERFRDRVFRVLHNLGIVAELEVVEPTAESEVPEEFRDTDASLCLDQDLRYLEERRAVEGKAWFAGTMSSSVADERILAARSPGPKIVFFIYQSKDARRDFILAFAWLEKEKNRVIRHKVLTFRPDGTFALDRSSKCFRHVEDVAKMMLRIGYAPLG